MTTPQPSIDSFELGDYLSLLRRRWWIVVGLACACLLLGAAYTVVSPKSYTATSSVFVTPNAANITQAVGGRTSGAINMDNESQIVQSDAVAALVAKQLHSTNLADLINQITVVVPANTTVLQISCAAPAAKQAAACAQDFANSYLASRQATAQTKINAQMQQEETRAAPLQAQAIDLQNKIDALPSSSPRLAADHAALENVSSQLAPLRAAIASFGASTNYNSGYIITSAVPPRTPSSPRKLLYLPAALMVGLLVGLIAAFIVDRRDDRIHSARDLPRFLDVPVLFRPYRGKARLDTSVASARSGAGHAFTELAQSLTTSLGDGNHVILVAGTSDRPGVSVVAANLAATLARTRGDVILVCADMSYSLSPEMLGVAEGRGLAELIAGSATVDEVARQSTAAPRLRVITPGVDTAAALQQVQYDASRRMISAMRSEARYVVVEVAGTSDGADTLSLAEFADAALIVAELGQTQRSEVAACIQRLDRLRTEVLGAAVLPTLNRAARTTARSAASAWEAQAPQRVPSGDASDGPHRRGDQQRRPAAAGPESRDPDELREPRPAGSATPEEVGARPRADKSARGI